MSFAAEGVSFEGYRFFEHIITQDNITSKEIWRVEVPSCVTAGFVLGFLSRVYCINIHYVLGIGLLLPFQHPQLYQRSRRWRVALDAGDAAEESVS